MRNANTDIHSHIRDLHPEIDIDGPEVEAILSQKHDWPELNEGVNCIIVNKGDPGWEKLWEAAGCIISDCEEKFEC